MKIEQYTVDFKERAKARIGSLDKATHTPGGGNVKIEQNKVDFKGKYLMSLIGYYFDHFLPSMQAS